MPDNKQPTQRNNAVAELENKMNIRFDQQNESFDKRFESLERKQDEVLCLLRGTGANDLGLVGRSLENVSKIKEHISKIEKHDKTLYGNGNPEEGLVIKVKTLHDNTNVFKTRKEQVISGFLSALGGAIFAMLVSGIALKIWEAVSSTAK